MSKYALEARPSAAPKADWAYTKRLASWFAGTAEKYGGYLPENYSLKFLTDPSMSNDQRYAEAVALRYQVISNAKKKRPHHSNKAHLSFEEDGKGGLYVIDRTTNRVEAAIHRSRNGLSFSGDLKYVEQLGGRGNFSTITSMFSDKSYLDDVKKN